MFTTTMNESAKTTSKPKQFGKLTLNRDTLCQMGAELPGMTNDRTAVDNCPVSTTTRVTAHCC